MSKNITALEVGLGGKIPLNNLEFIRVWSSDKGVLFCFGVKGGGFFENEGAENSVVFNVRMIGVRRFKYKGKKGGVITTPTIRVGGDYAFIEIRHPCIKLKCIADSLKLESAGAYIDDRWE
ncbi:hypothetical protein [Aeromonas veronii]|uniref:hypothetical protein n=1 Tax=Aeromonas veronii TaxID=654 RepID=UPI0009703A6B|nr:hypothetical protein [Aeromonas veronii]